MKLVRSIDSNRLPAQGCVLTIGNFDGVHLGHRKILKTLVGKGKDFGLPAVVMTFLPSPEEYFKKEKAAPRLSGLSARYFALKEQGIDYMLAIPFNGILANTSARAFIEHYLINRLQIQYILTGDDFRFGSGRRGDYRMLRSFAGRHHFEAERMATVADGDSRISSTRIRNALAAGEFDRAKQMLGRNYTMIGRVIHGDKRGTKWGFPTLNIAVTGTPPFTGVFVVSVSGIGDSVYHGVANLGARPTVDGLRTLLEVHVFDFDGQIYGAKICVSFLTKIRGEKKFESFDRLKNQIMMDCDYGKSFVRERELDN